MLNSILADYVSCSIAIAGQQLSTEHVSSLAGQCHDDAGITLKAIDQQQLHAADLVSLREAPLVLRSEAAVKGCSRAFRNETLKVRSGCTRLLYRDLKPRMTS